MEKMLFSGVQSNSDVALIVIKGLKHQPGIAAKIFGSIADEKINVELILQSIGRDRRKIFLLSLLRRMRTRQWRH